MIPEEKVNGLRFGQLIYAALMNHAEKYGVTQVTDTCTQPDLPMTMNGSADHYISDKLFQIENDQLNAAIERVLKASLDA